MITRRWLLFFTALALLFPTPGCNAPPPAQSPPAELSPISRLTMVTGPLDKEFIRLGALLAEIINWETERSRLQIAIQASPGSLFNVEAVSTGAASLGLVQSQFLYRHKFEAGSAQPSNVRLLTQLNRTGLSLLASDTSNLWKIEDLPGKTIGLIKPASTDRKTLVDVLRCLGLKIQDVPAPGEALDGDGTPSMNTVYVVEKSRSKIEAGLRDGSIDGVFTMVVHPSNLVRTLLIHARLHFVQITVDMQRLKAITPVYSETTIPIGLYPDIRNGSDVHTVGTATVLTASSALPEEAAYRLTAAIYDKADVLQENTLFRAFTTASMVDGIQTDLLHPGALRFFKEKRMIKASCPEDTSDANRAFAVITLPGSEWRAGLARSLEADAPADSAVPGAAPAPATTGALPTTGVAGSSSGQAEPDSIVPASSAPDASSEARAIAGRLSSDSSRLGLLPMDSVENTWTATVDPSKRLLRRNLRSICRLPGELVHVVVGATTGIERVEDLSLRRLAFSSRISPTLLRRLVARLDGASADWDAVSVLEEAVLVSRYLTGELDGIILLGGAPSPTVQQALARRSLFLPLDMPVNDASYAVIEAAHLPASVYPVALGGRDLPTWMVPEVLLVVDRAPVPKVQAMTSRMLEALTAAPALLARVPGGRREWLAQGLPYPLHEGAAAHYRSLGFAVESSVQSWAEPLTIGGNGADETALRAALTVALASTLHCQNAPTEPDCLSGIEGAVVPTGLSADTIRAVAGRRVDFGLARADVLYDAVQGVGDWNASPQKGLRTVATLYTPALTVLVSERENDSQVEAAKVQKKVALLGIQARGLADLHGRRVSIRHDAGSQPRDNSITMFNERAFFAKQWRNALLTEESAPMTGVRLFAEGSIQGLFSITAHPTNWIASLLQRDPTASIIPVTGLDEHLSNLPYLARALINVGIYEEDNERDMLVPSIGIPVVLIASKDTPDARVRALLGALERDMATVRKANPTLLELSSDLMRSTAIAPMHDAAATFYREVDSERRQCAVADGVAGN